jgi:hypothetical protein
VRERRVRPAAARRRRRSTRLRRPAPPFERGCRRCVTGRRPGSGAGLRSAKARAVSRRRAARLVVLRAAASVHHASRSSPATSRRRAARRALHFIEAALGLGRARGFLSRQPQVGVQLDGDLAFAAIAVQLVVERADTDRPRLRRQPRGQFLRRARFCPRGRPALSPGDSAATPVRARAPGSLPARPEEPPVRAGSAARRRSQRPAAVASARSSCRPLLFSGWRRRASNRCGRPAGCRKERAWRFPSPANRLASRALRVPGLSVSP